MNFPSTYDMRGSRLSKPGEPPWDIALLFPVQGNWSEGDYLELSTNHFVELSHGCIEVLPMPTKLHQRIVQFLFLVLHEFVSARKLGEVFVAPLPVRLWPGQFREPDIVYLRPGRGEFRGQPEGADLVMEVVSEGEENRRRDMEEKRKDYAQAGIAEYWIVDPETQRVTVLVLKEGTYREQGVFGPGDTASSVVPAGFAVSVSDLFAAAQQEQK